MVFEGGPGQLLLTLQAAFSGPSTRATVCVAAVAADFDAIRRGLFSADFPDDLALGYLPRFQRESLGPIWS